MVKMKIYMKIKTVKDVGMGLCQYVDLCLRASFVLCILFGMPFLHLFTIMFL